MNGNYALLAKFRSSFEGTQYAHRNSTLGDLIAVELFEDLVALGRSKLLVQRVHSHECVVNTANRATGKRSRRGDSTFGELVPAGAAITKKGIVVARGPVANIQIGAETKILAKAMIKQIDRVIGDLQRQVQQFQRTGGNPISVGFVGINHAAAYTSFEGTRSFPTTGTAKFRHPIQEAMEAEARIRAEAAPAFDEFQFLKFRASNAPPFPFSWVNEQQTRLEYSSLLVRVSREYDQRFP